MKIITVAIMFCSLSPISISFGESLKTHKNRNGFSFQYPASWGVGVLEGKGEPEKVPIVGLVGPSEKIESGKNSVGQKNPWTNSEIGCEKQGNLKHRKESLDDLVKNQVVPKRIIVSIRDFILDEEPAKEVIFFDSLNQNVSASDAPVQKFVVVKHLDRTCQMLFQELGPASKTYKSEKDWKYKKEIDQIISSFRFTK